MPIIQSISRFSLSLLQPFAMLSYLNRQKKFIQKNINSLLAEAKNAKDGSLDEDDCKKITGYYGLAVPAVLGEAFCALRGKEMTAKERLASTCQGAMTGLGDDFFDKQRLSAQGVKDFIERPGAFTGNSASEKLFLHFYTTALNNAPHAEQMQQQLYKVFHAQLLSKQQDMPGIAYEMLKDITIRKGAESLLYYRTAFEHPLKAGEEKMLFCLGGLMQLSNDIFDVHKDYCDGVTTMATSAKKISELRFYYSAVLQMGFRESFRVGYPKKNVRKFLGILSIGIFSRCYVCMQLLEKLEKNTDGVFDVQAYKRNDLICDMDTAYNKWKSLRAHTRLMRFKR